MISPAAGDHPFFPLLDRVLIEHVACTAPEAYEPEVARWDCRTCRRWSSRKRLSVQSTTPRLPASCGKPVCNHIGAAIGRLRRLTRNLCAGQRRFCGATSMWSGCTSVVMLLFVLMRSRIFRLSNLVPRPNLFARDRSLSASLNMSDMARSTCWWP
jgi:hypothetical protein